MAAHAHALGKHAYSMVRRGLMSHRFAASAVSRLGTEGDATMRRLDRRIVFCVLEHLKFQSAAQIEKLGAPMACRNLLGKLVLVALTMYAVRHASSRRRRVAFAL